MIFLEILALITIGFSLSIDAFTLSTLYGIINCSNKKICLVSLITGFFHFIMPIIGFLLCRYVNKYIDINSKYILILVLIFIMIEMIKSLKDEKLENNEMALIDMFIFAFLVSIDSFSLGLGINYITNNIIIASLIFALMSGVFTFLGFKLGNFITNKFRDVSKYVGIMILSIVIVYIMFKV